MTKHTASDIADWFLAWADVSDAEVSNLKIQKLLYYAQGHFMGATGAPLFDDDLQAWAHGPVVPSIYRRFKRFGSGAIDVDEVSPQFDWSDFEDVQQHLADVWSTYGEYSAWALRNRTHREAPWVQTWDSESLGAVIPKQSMREFFAPMSARG